MRFLIPVIAVLMFVGARPFSVDDAGIVDKGDYELEAGVSGWNGVFATEVGFKHGLTGRMDIGLEFSYDFYPLDTRKFSDVELSMKFSLSDNIALSFGNPLGKKEYSLNLILTGGSNSLQANLNSGVDFMYGKDANPTLGIMILKDIGSLSIGGEFTAKYGEQPSLLFGVIYHTLPGLQLDMGFSSTLSNPLNPNVTMGFHKEF